jgi:hypothetical protein
MQNILKYEALGCSEVSLRRFGYGSSSPFNFLGESLNNSNRFLFMEQEQQAIHLMQHAPTVI